MAVTDDAGDAFCHADVRVGRSEAAERRPYSGKPEGLHYI
jgi:hypothetical protein